MQFCSEHVQFQTVDWLTASMIDFLISMVNQDCFGQRLIQVFYFSHVFQHCWNFPNCRLLDENLLWRLCLPVCTWMWCIWVCFTGLSQILNIALLVFRKGKQQMLDVTYFTVSALENCNYALAHQVRCLEDLDQCIQISQLFLNIWATEVGIRVNFIRVRLKLCFKVKAYPHTVSHRMWYNNCLKSTKILLDVST